MKEKLMKTALGLMAAACLMASHNASAQSNAPWPSKPIRFVVTFPAGGSSDAAARIVAPKLSKRLGQPVMVDNKPGAGGGVGLDLVAKAPEDGYTIVLASAGGLAANPSLYPNLSYNPSTDFAPITLFGTSPFVLIANSTVPVKSIKDVIELAKTKDAKLSYASGGNGTAMHLSGELIKSMAGINLLHVPYRGSAPALMSVMGGETSLAIADIATIEPQMKSSKIKILGVLNKQRSALAPDLPTLAESGLPGFEANGWFAVLAPAGVAHTTVARLNAEIVGVLREAETAEKFAQAGLEPLSSSPEELAQYIKSETIKWSKVIAVSGAKVD
jgi:tripartite-type tricarboxylate transporter receptor subunit TctC